SQKKPQDFSRYKLYKLTSFEDEENKEVITDSQLNELFGMKDLNVRFNLYHYIEQEESAHLFKKTDKDRMAIISKLFNIEEETNQKLFLERTRYKLIQYKSQSIKDLSNLEDVLGEDSTLVIDYCPYRTLISQAIIFNVTWDKEIIHSLDQKLLQKLIKELHLIKNLLLYKKELQSSSCLEKLYFVI